MHGFNPRGEIDVSLLYFPPFFTLLFHILTDLSLPLSLNLSLHIYFTSAVGRCAQVYRLKLYQITARIPVRVRSLIVLGGFNFRTK